jgi:hypothetical protein
VVIDVALVSPAKNSSPSLELPGVSAEPVAVVPEDELTADPAIGLLVLYPDSPTTSMVVFTLFVVSKVTVTVPFVVPLPVALYADTTYLGGEPNDWLLMAAGVPLIAVPVIELTAGWLLLAWR